VIVATAIASRDYQDVHHDPGLAVERGSPDIFMNILSSNGFVGRYVTDWSGPGAVIEKVAIRLGAPNYPGDTMVFTGQVTAADIPADRHDGRGVVEIAVRGANSRGDHVTGTVRLSLPVTP
jgi:acyl dehydratase